MMRGAAALIAGGMLPAKAWAAPFFSRRSAATVRGAGRDVVLIAGLASGPGLWNGVVGALPGYRWHLVHVRGFAGLPADANASGPLVQPLADEIARYIAAAAMDRPAIVGPRMGGTLARTLGWTGLAGRLWGVVRLSDGGARGGGQMARAGVK